MSIFVDIALFGWIPAVLVLFSAMRPLRAVLASFVAAWLFLPMAALEISGLPNFTKMTATCYGVLIGVLLFDAKRFFSFRPGAIDIPMLVWCMMPFVTGIANGKDLKLNVALFLTQLVTWGMPWFIGRLYLTSLEAFRETAVALVVGGLVYVPFCWYELVMSPQLHYMVYGFYQHEFIQTVRAGGWRPMVFMQHGLMLAAWMMSASLVGIWLWWSGSVTKIRSAPLSWLLVPLVTTTVMCKSLGALVLMGVGLIALVAIKYLRLIGLLAVLAALPVAFVTARLVGGTAGDPLVAVATMVDPARADSLQFRLKNEDILMQKALQHPILGWGWGDNRVKDEEGVDKAVTDGMWVIYLGVYGILGLGALYGVLLLPPALAAWKVRKSGLPPQAVAPVLALCAVAILFAVDTIPNSMVNPIFSLICGGLGNAIALFSQRGAPPVTGHRLEHRIPTGLVLSVPQLPHTDRR